METSVPVGEERRQAVNVFGFKFDVERAPFDEGVYQLRVFHNNTFVALSNPVPNDETQDRIYIMSWHDGEDSEPGGEPFVYAVVDRLEIQLARLSW